MWENDLVIPDVKYTSDTLHPTQALGDCRALIDEGGRVLVHLVCGAGRGWGGLGARIQAAISTQLNRVP